MRIPIYSQAGLEGLRMQFMRFLGLLLFACAVGCGAGSKGSMVCSKTTSLLRFQVSPGNAITNAANLAQFASNGGFIQIKTRSTTLGLVDKLRTCTAYVEYSSAPDAVVPVDVEFNIYTASHCVNLAKDYSMTLQLFMYDPALASIKYYPVELSYEPLNAVQKLRLKMKSSGVSAPDQEKILAGFETPQVDVTQLFNVVSGVTGTNVGPSEKVGQVCLKKDDANYQHVCATYQDLMVIKAKPSSSTPESVKLALKALQSSSVTRLKNWISASKLKLAMDASPSLALTFSANNEKKYTLSQLHEETRARLNRFSKFRTVQKFAESLGPDLANCASAKSAACVVLPELADVVKNLLPGTSYESITAGELAAIIPLLKPDFQSALLGMDDAFTVFENLAVAKADGSLSIGYEARIHSNYRFLDQASSTVDLPDPLDPLRGFLHIHVNNLTGDKSGGLVEFIRWNSETLKSRFLHLNVRRSLSSPLSPGGTETDQKTLGFLQAGDSGSIVVMEHMPFFTVTTVDGTGTSGGAVLRPLPETINPDSEILATQEKSKGVAGKSIGALCK